MRLAPQLVLAFGFVALLSVAGVGAWLREDRHTKETARFDADVKLACTRVSDELQRLAESDQRLVSGACQAGELVDSTFVAMQQGALDARRVAIAARVGKAREAFGLDELLLATDRGEVLGADPRSLLSMPRADVETAMRGNAASFSL